MMMASKSMKVLNIIAGVLLIVAGIYCLCNQDIAAMTAGVMVGIFMLLSGVIEIVVFATTSGLLFGSGWLLLDGVLTVILSLFLLFNQWFTMSRFLSCLHCGCCFPVSRASSVRLICEPLVFAVGGGF